MLGALKRHPITVVIVVVLAAVAGLTIDKIRTGQDNPNSHRRFSGPVAVSVATVSTARFVDRIEALGTALANESVDITAKVTETVSRVNFDDGQKVERDAILVDLSNAEEQAQLAEFRANLAEARKQFTRISGLVKRGNAAVSVLDAQTAAVETARARIEAVTARLSDRRIRAPFAGVLGFRRVSPGTLVTPNTVITTLDDTSVIKLDFPVPEVFLPGLRTGQTIRATSVAYPGRNFVGTVATIDSRVDPITRAVMVRAIIANDDLRLRPGMLLGVVLDRGGRDSLAVPEQALVPVQNRQFVFVVDAQGIAERRLVRIDRRRPGLVEITSGLTAGEIVVIEGMMSLRPGTKVMITSHREPPGEIAVPTTAGLTAPAPARTAN